MDAALRKLTAFSEREIDYICRTILQAGIYTREQRYQEL